MGNQRGRRHRACFGGGEVCDPRVGKILDGQKFEICNEAGELHATVPFKDTLRLD